MAVSLLLQLIVSVTGGGCSPSGSKYWLKAFRSDQAVHSLFTSKGAVGSTELTLCVVLLRLKLVPSAQLVVCPSTPKRSTGVLFLYSTTASLPLKFRPAIFLTRSPSTSCNSLRPTRYSALAGNTPSKDTVSPAVVEPLEKILI